VRSCCEASGAGFVLHRRLKQDGFHCEVIAPSRIPRKPGDRRKCDRLDAVMLARLDRSGHLTPVHVPTERSSGDRERKGPITKAGNAYARRILIEAAWNNSHRSGADLILNRRRQGQPPGVVAIAVNAQHRLSKRFHHLDQRKHRNKVVTAVARELCGFVWAIMKAAPRCRDAAQASYREEGSRQENPRLRYAVRASAPTRDPGVRQLRTNKVNRGTQSANISLMVVGCPPSSRSLHNG